jgi:hypothetical protein
LVYLAAVIDWNQPLIVAHRVAITRESGHRWHLEETFAKNGLPQIDNTDQANQFTGTVFPDAIRGIARMLDGEGSRRAGPRTMLSSRCRP